MTSDCTTHWPDLEARLGHVFARRDLLAAALTHSSYVAENAAPGIPESQRLEFLGDAVLSLVAAEWLVAHCAGWREGTLTKVRSRLTNATTLARVARRLQLEECLRWGRGLPRRARPNSARGRGDGRRSPAHPDACHHHLLAAGGPLGDAGG
ncbi:MAG TPA: ribonuclease III domain-containing protein, partial [Kiritimatiellia bacterium]|nr:ribonuclease III domain-containing protein [Kiritimatiellia bacterium]